MIQNEEEFPFADDPQKELDDSNLESIPISNTDENISENKGIPVIFAILISILIGIMGGCRSHSQRESIIYAGMFLSESVVSFMVSKIVSTVSFRQTAKRISVFILIQALACYFSYNLPQNIKNYF